MKKRVFVWTAFCLALFAEELFAESIPGFESAAIYQEILESHKTTLPPKLSFRERESKEWRDALPPVISPDGKEFRGTIFNLKENTFYEYKITADGKDFSGIFKTKTRNVPVKETIILTQKDFEKGSPVIKSGTPDGYIRYTSARGSILKAGRKKPHAILLENIQNVILEGITLQGGGYNALTIKNCKNIQILNCDISHYGTPRMPFDLSGGKKGVRKIYCDNGKWINNQAGIQILGGKNILIERNYIHDAESRANSWFYAHPSGPNALFIGDTDELTVRWNDFVGSDTHRWNDAVEGDHNGRVYGGPARNAEIYGNYLAFGNDDGIELDGGQKNVRFFRNRVEGFLCGISTAPCIEGPSYLVENLIMNPGEEFGFTGSAVKNGGFKYYPGRIFVFQNTFTGPMNGLSGYTDDKLSREVANTIKTFGRNNVFATEKGFFSSSFFQVRNDFNQDCFPGKFQGPKEFESNPIPEKIDFQNAENGKYILKKKIVGENIPNLGSHAGISQNHPERPLPISSSAYTVTLNSKNIQKKVTIEANSPQYSESFRIVHPEASGYFHVAPVCGTLKYGTPVTLTITALPEKAEEARKHSGAFLIRTDHGLSVPISVYFDNRDDLAKVKKIRDNAVYAKITGRDSRKTTFEFELKEDGKKYLFLNMNIFPGKIALSIDGTPFQPMQFRRSSRTNCWGAVSRLQGEANIPFFLSKGLHKMTIERTSDLRFAVRNAALADSPEVFLFAPLTSAKSVDPKQSNEK